METSNRPKVEQLLPEKFARLTEIAEIKPDARYIIRFRDYLRPELVKELAQQIGKSLETRPGQFVVIDAHFDIFEIER